MKVKPFEVGDRVVTKSFMYKGSGVITYIDKANIFNAQALPIQVELDEPDFDGHSLKRFTIKEVKHESK